MSPSENATVPLYSDDLPIRYYLTYPLVSNLADLASRYIASGKFSLPKSSPKPNAPLSVIRIRQDNYYAETVTDWEDRPFAIYLTAEYSQKASFCWGLVSHHTHRTVETTPIVILDVPNQTLILIWPAPRARETAWSIFRLSDSDLYSLCEVPEQERKNPWQHWILQKKESTLIGEGKTTDETTITAEESENDRS